MMSASRMFGGEGGDIVDGIGEGHRAQSVFEVDRAVGLIGEPKVHIADAVGELLVRDPWTGFCPSRRRSASRSGPAGSREAR